MDKRLPHRIRDIRLQLQASGKTATADGALSRHVASRVSGSGLGLWSEGLQFANIGLWRSQDEGCFIRLMGRIEEEVGGTHAYGL